MKPKEISLIVFGSYMALVPGLLLMAVPSFMLDLFQLSHDANLWTARMVGLLASIIGIYYFLVVKHKVEPFYMGSVIIRYYAATFMVGLYLFHQVEIAILLFAFVDAAGATWTLLTLKKA